MIHLFKEEQTIFVVCICQTVGKLENLSYLCSFKFITYIFIRFRWTREWSEKIEEKVSYEKIDEHKINALLKMKTFTNLSDILFC